MELPGQAIFKEVKVKGHDWFSQLGRDMFWAMNEAVLNQHADCPDELAPPEDLVLTSAVDSQ
jgi:hypothetical protein